MNTNTDAKKILFYGDSLVQGKVSGKNERLDSKTRFTGVLQDLLGQDYEILEEGLRARTVSGENPFFPDRDGLAQYSSIIGSCLPVDLVVFLLGTNDCNSKMKRDANEVASDFLKYKSKTEEWSSFNNVPMPKILLLSPPMVDAKKYDPVMQKIFGDEAPELVAQLAKPYERIANDANFEFLDCAQYCEPSSGDGIHLDAENNRKLATALHKKITQII